MRHAEPPRPFAVIGWSLTVLLLTSAVGAARPWEAVQFSHQSRSFARVCYGSGLFVAVGEGVIATWDGVVEPEVHPVPVIAEFLDVAHNDRHYLVVGRLLDNPDKGVVLASRDGSSWREVHRGPGAFRGVAWGNDQWLILGDEGIVVTDEELIDWMAIDVREMAADFLNHAVWTGEQWIAVGGGGADPEDPEKWILSSPDGFAWSTVARPSHYPLTRVVWNGEVAVALGSPRSLWSYDGVYWTEADDSSGRGLVWDGSRFVSVSWGWVSGTMSFTSTSPDGITWTQEFWNGWGAMEDVAWDGSRYVVVGEGFGQTSDLDTWSGAPTSMEPDLVYSLVDTDYGVMALAVRAWWDLYYSGYSGWFALAGPDQTWPWQRLYNPCGAVAVRRGTAIDVCANEGKVYVSHDLVDWSISLEGGIPWRAVAGEPGFVIVLEILGHLALPFSPDGDHWIITHIADGVYLRALEWTGECFLALCNIGVARSYDGLLWSFEESADPGTTWGLAGNGEVIVRTTPTGIEISGDGLHWKPAVTAVEPELYRVHWTGHRFVAVGEHGAVATSLDGSIWQVERTGFPFRLLAAYELGGELYVGGDGVLLKRRQPLMRASGHRPVLRLKP